MDYTANKMKRTDSFVLATALLAWAAWGVWQQRTARVTSATVVRVTGSPPKADIRLTFTAGPRPACVLVDVRGEYSEGSSTVYGERDTIQVILDSPLRAQHTVTVTASSRIFGCLRTSTQVFHNTLV